MEMFGYLIVFCYCAFSIIFIILSIVRTYKEDKLKKEASGAKNGKHKVEFTTVKVQAEVIDLNCYAEVLGYKTPKLVKKFTAVFETDEKKIIKINVPQEMYDGLEVGQNGEATFVNGELYSFIITNE